MNFEEYDFVISKILYTLVALFGFLIVFIAGLYYGYTFKENEQQFYANVTEIKLVNYINTHYTYDFTEYEGKYSDSLAPRIQLVTLISITIGVILLEIGYRNHAKYKYDKPLKQRLKDMWESIKNEE